MTAQESLVLQASDLSLETIAAMVESEAIDVSPGYQRRARWDTQKQGALIESFLLNVPVPPVYLAEEDYGTYSVIDGKQRITTIAAFMRNELPLRGLERFDELDGSSFEDLPPELANALRVRPYVRAVTLLKQSDPQLKYEVFTRLNTGGVKLNAQEIRNVAYSGPLNDLVYELAENPFLRQQLKIRGPKSSAFTKMLDAEYVLRFLTLSESWRSFSGDLSRSMDSYMLSNRFATSSDIRATRKKFRSAIEGCEAIWGARAFQRPAGSGWRDQALAGMYDAQMIAVSELSPSQQHAVAQEGTRASKSIRRLFQDSDFDSAVRQGTNTPSRVRYRIRSTSEALLGLIKAD